MFFNRSSMMSLWALLLLLLCTQRGCDATIRVVDLETEYLSRPDKYVGLQMKTGIEYGARLQSIPGDPHLCGGQDFNVTVPEDGRPGTFDCVCLLGFVELVVNTHGMECCSHTCFGILSLWMNWT